LRMDQDQRRALQEFRGELTEFEAAVLDGYLEDGERGWQTRVASEHVNPATGKPFTRPMPAKVLPRILGRIKERLELGDEDECLEDVA